MSAWGAVFVLSLGFFTGCAAAYTPSPLTPQHPAYPEAVTAPELPRSTTLAYGPSDMPSPQPAFMTQQRTYGDQQAEQKSQQAVVGEGKVIAVVPGSSQIVVDHKEIKGFMDAMTMGYRTDPPSLLEGVQTGDTIRFTIDTQQKAIVRIEKINK
jgi:Cu/Ag efflux protein CusF